MKITIFCTMPDAGILNGILELHKNIFGDSDDL